MEKFKVLIPLPVSQEALDIFEQHDCTVICLPNDSEQEIEKYIEEVDAILLRTTNFRKEMIDKARNLKIIARHGVGFDQIDVEYAISKGIQVCYAPLSNINSVAEHTVMLMMALAKRVNEGQIAVRTNQFNKRNGLLGIELKDKTVGLIGLGNIGKLVAQKCHFGFGMNIIAYDPYVKELNEEYIHLEDSLEKLLKSADFISLHVPYLPETHHLIGERELEHMKPTSYLINAARGGILDEQAVLTAIHNGVIAGAALDVFEGEPFDINEGWYSVEQAVLTPHVAALTIDAMRDMAIVTATQIVDVKCGNQPSFSLNEQVARR
ncbi:hydroxyacid dehydrogenase [Ureibacillus aquaedulcis]|uniref:Hydroxyacid dehydrogenase n=1 Tax=Ureibacillus aquaedulcis TaxID=3058421 RepID=A0ABT8GQ21_9BACL|nr:hydroxyacid dehydrogenase [Ureibacillus sp. BA0131]MDN4493494.1 hydroxyacid dehydrogenase [Ureibacillus sp. BA0131]